MLKKFLAVLTAAAVLAPAAAFSAAASVVIDDTYDTVMTAACDDCNSGAGTGAPDGTKYKIAAAGDEIFKKSDIDTSKNFYMSVDINFSAAALTRLSKSGDTIPNELITFSGSKTGTAIVVNLKGDFSAQTGSTSWPTLVAFDTNKWYKLEFEGCMDGDVYLTLSEYSGSAATQVYTGKLNMRNITKASYYTSMKLAENVWYDNVYAAIREPDETVVTQESGTTEISAGQSVGFSAVSYIDGTAENIVQPSYTWSLTDGSGNALSDSTITLEASGTNNASAVVSTTYDTKAQTIMVKAAATTKGSPSCSYTLNITETNVDAEPFTEAVLTGYDASTAYDTITAGDTAGVTYGFTASKNGSPAALSDQDYRWVVYDKTGTRELGNKLIAIENGRITADASVLAQTVMVKVATPSGAFTSDGRLVQIENAPSGEDLICYNACEDAYSDAGAAALMAAGSRSWDGSGYYVAGTTNASYKDSDFLGSGKLGSTSSSGDILISLDMKFTEEGTGFRTVPASGNRGIYLCCHNNSLQFQTGSSSYKNTGYSLSDDKWYHIDLMFNTAGCSVAIGEYSGLELTNVKTYTDTDIVKFRSVSSFNKILVNTGTGIDNYRVLYPNPTEMTILDEAGNELTSAISTVYTGGSRSFGLAGKRGGLIMRSLVSAARWAVCSGDTIIDNDEFDISGGRLTVSAVAAPQTLRVRAMIGDVAAYAPIEVGAADQFEITNIGVDSEDTNKVVKLFVNKLTDYKDEVMFLMTLYNDSGVLVGSYAKKANAKNMVTGENEISVDYTLPSAFDKTTGAAKLWALTPLTVNEEPKGVSHGFAASYGSGIISLSGMPSVPGSMSAAVYTANTSDSALKGDTSGNIVYAARFDSAADSIAVELPAGEYIITIGGAVVNGSYATYKARFTVN